MIRKVVLKNLPIILLALSGTGIAEFQLTSNDPGYEVLASDERDADFTLEAMESIKITPGMNDAWYEPATSGQGFFITVFPDMGYVSLAWFTYDTELPPPEATANLGDPGHRWLTAVGPIVDNMAIMNIEMTSGGIFDTASEITRTDPPGSDGTITLSFSSCNSGTIEYDIPSINRQGTVEIERVATDNVALCDALNPVPGVCDRWNADRADLSEGTWSGSVNECNAGDISPKGRANALKLVNLYRFLAGLPPVTTDPTLDQKTQECALMMDANNRLSHEPDNSWTCYTSEGDEAAGSSSISSARGVLAVDRYMVDEGAANATSMGHRRWILSNSLGPIGLGSTSDDSCMWVFNGTGSGGNEWTAWPPPGEFPIEAVAPSGTSIDATGWTIQSDVSLNGAQVTIQDGGIDLPVTVTNLDENFGARYAIKMVPQGWTTTAGHTYEVSVTGIDSPFNYQVQVVGCQ